MGEFQSPTPEEVESQEVMPEELKPEDVKPKEDEEIFVKAPDFGAEVIVPERTLVEPYEGVHLRIEPNNEELPYFNPEAKITNSLNSFLVAMATTSRKKTKEALERHMPEYLNEFVNFQLNSLETKTNET